MVSSVEGCVPNTLSGVFKFLYIFCSVLENQIAQFSVITIVLASPKNGFLRRMFCFTEILDK